MKLYHYTKIENLTSIVQKDGLSFWLTDYREFDDPSEGELILKVQQQFYPKWVYNNIERYVLSLSRRHDNLAMWREYANNATGLVLEIETNNVKPSIFSLLLECDYSDKTIKERSEAVKNICDEYGKIDAAIKYGDYCKRFPDLEPEDLKDFNEKLAVMDASVELIRVKNACYSYEEEIRYIVKAFDAEKFHYYIKNGKLRKCYEFNMNKNALTKIYVGSNNNSSILSDIKKYLDVIHLSDIDVEMMDLPYRTR